MNINMTDAVFINALGEKHKFENYYIKDRNIRYVHIPDQVPIISTIEKQLGKLVNPGRGRGKRATEETFKVRRAVRKQKETLALIQEQRVIKEEDDQQEENQQEEDDEEDKH